MELHLVSCADCAARLETLQSLFNEIESLPDVALSPEFAVHAAPSPGQSLPQLLRLALTLQAALAVVAIFLAIPFVMPAISPYLSGLPVPALAEIFILVQNEWMSWLDVLSTLQLPAMAQVPAVELSSLFMLFTLVFVSLLWLIGNGLLLRSRMK
jgi:hypothetical protein